MLENKDYCDYDTCVALMDLGMRITSRKGYSDRNTLKHSSRGITYTVRTASAMGWVIAIPLYEAQKFLREEKGLYVEIEIFEYTYGYRILDTKNVYYDNEHVVRDNGCLVGSYEDALLEGIKKAVKILKEK